MALFTKTTSEIVSEALLKVTNSTSITATSPGSVARAFIEAVATELGDFYSILDFNLSQYNLSTATGSSLDLIGSIYNVTRKNITNLSIIDRALGAFYFYLDAPYSSNITIPNGTIIQTDNTSYVGNQFTYATTDTYIIPAGRTKVYASILPQFTGATYTAGVNTLTVIGSSFTQPTGATVRCTNPKTLEAQVGQESDDSYRYRIQQAVRVAAGGTIDSVRLSGIGVAGVRDVSVRNTPYGLGSFECLVTPEDYAQAQNVLIAATTAMDAVRPIGVRMYSRLPTFLPVDVGCSIVISSTLNIDTTTIVNGAQVAVVQFLNQPLVGSQLVYNELIQAIMNSSDAILDVTLNNLAVNATQVLFKNYTPAADEQLVPGTVTVGIAS